MVLDEEVRFRGGVGTPMGFSLVLEPTIFVQQNLFDPQMS